MRRLLLISLLLALSCAPAASARTSRCAVLPAALSLSTTDPTTLIDDAAVVVAPRTGGPAIDGLQVSVRRGRTTVAAGSLPGRLSRRASVRLTTVGRPGKGTYTIAASGKARGCAKRAAVSRSWTLQAPSLPVRAVPLGVSTDDGQATLRVRMRTVGRQSVAGLRAVLRDDSGATVAQASHDGAFSDEVVVELALPAGATTATGYDLALTGRANGTAARSDYTAPIAVPAAAATATSPDGTPTTTGARAPVQHVVVDWSGGDFAGKSTAGFDAPGIGYGELLCRPDAQWIRFFPKSPGDEVAMLNWTYRDWGGGTEKALREALHTMGTGNDFREGLNKFGPPEKTSTGEFTGIISDRGPIGSTGGVALPAPTTLHLTWKWDFSQSGKESCHIQADFVTDSAAGATPVARSASILWRGDAASAGRDAAAIALPGPAGGTASLVCQATPSACAASSSTAPRAATSSPARARTTASPPGPPARSRPSCPTTARSRSTSRTARSCSSPRAGRSTTRTPRRTAARSPRRPSHPDAQPFSRNSGLPGPLLTWQR